MAYTTDVRMEYHDSQEPPIDLESHIDKQLQASQLLVATLRSRNSTPDSAALLADILVTRNQLSLLKSYISTTYSRVIVDPADDDYLILKAIGARLDNAIWNSEIAHAPTDALALLVNTIKRALQIADTLTAP